MKKRIVSFLCLIIMLAICLASCKEAVSVTGAEVNADGDLIITMSDGTTQNLGKVKGADGQNGSNAENPQCLDFYPLPDGTYAVSLGNAIMLENIVIPATYQGKTVTKVIKPDFSALFSSEKPAAKVITLPDTITSLGYGAFAGCLSLESVTIPNSVTSIDNYAFDGCSSLESINIPSGVTSIGDGAFDGCSSLESVTIPNSVTSIGNSVFSGCSSLESVTIPNSVTSIGNSVFSGCSSLESVTIPSGVTSIGNSAFYGCSSLKSINIPSGVTSIGNGAFSYCSSLESINIPSGVTSIGNCAFQDCSSLENVTFIDPNGWSADNFSISATKLQETDTAADLLTNNYTYSTWTKATN